MRLTHDPAIDDMPDWSWDGKRIAFQSARGGRYQIWQMDADGTGSRWLTDDETGALQPRFSPVDDRIAYLVLQKGATKIPSYDLVVANLKTTEKQVIARGEPVGGIAWDPNGKSIAYSTLGNLFVYSLAESRVTKTIKFEESSKDLYYHRGGNLVWRSDGGGLACRVEFIGGRAKGSPEDSQMLVSPLEGKSHLISFSSEVYPLGWDMAADRVGK
jgi:Tol biopolymer transport system component